MTDAMARVMGAGPTRRSRYRFRHRDGSWRHLESLGRNLLDHPDVAGLIVNTRDVTEQVLLSARLQEVREEEKARIARDLHDQLGQLLTGLKLDLLWLEERLEAMPTSPAVNALIERAVGASELSERLVAEVQRIATDLRPAALDRLGLGAALRQEARRFEKRTGVRCRVEEPVALPALPPAVAVTLYRIAQEALTNVARHARARSVSIRLEAGRDRVAVAVEDDGVGIDPARAEDPGALGLAGMRERATLEGGELLLARRREGGTRVEARLPLPEDREGGRPGGDG
jgi:signal transduction histidine kinase